MRLLCRVLEVSPAGYYAWREGRRARRSSGATPSSWRSRPSTPRSRPATAARASTPSWWPGASDCCVNTVAKLMREHGIAAKTARKFRCTTDSNHDRPVAENLLDRQFDPAAAERAWVADITYIPTREGWLYLAAVEDLYSRRVVGWSMDEQMDSRLVVDALEMAVHGACPARGCWRTRTGAASTPASTTSASWPSTGSRAA